MYDLVISGKLYDDTEKYIGINGEFIEEISVNSLKGKKEINLPTSSIIFPGFIDSHVHFRFPGWEHKEDHITGSRALVHAGVTTVGDMPNTPVATTSRERVLEKMEIAKTAPIDIFVYGGVGPDNLDKLEEMADLVPAYKIFTAESVGDLWFKNWDDIEKATEILTGICKPRNKPVLYHCEDQETNEKAKKALKGKAYPWIHSNQRPNESEEIAVKRVLDLAEKYNHQTHILHISTQEALRQIEKYKQNHDNVTFEVTPHHTFFTKDDMKKNPFLKMNPPLRSASNKIAINRELYRGLIDTLGSDHAPHTIEEKQNGVAGVPSGEAFGNFVAYLVNLYLDKNYVAKLTSENPAKLMGLDDRGRIEQGLLANISVIDMAPTIIQKPYYTKCNWSPFEGYVLPGRATYTICRGKVLMDNGKVLI